MRKVWFDEKITFVWNNFWISRFVINPPKLLLLFSDNFDDKSRSTPNFNVNITLTSFWVYTFLLTQNHIIKLRGSYSKSSFNFVWKNEKKSSSAQIVCTDILRKSDLSYPSFYGFYLRPKMCLNVAVHKHKHSNMWLCFSRCV